MYLEVNKLPNIVQRMFTIPVANKETYWMAWIGKHWKEASNYE